MTLTTTFHRLVGAVLVAGAFHAAAIHADHAHTETDDIEHHHEHHFGMKLRAKTEGGGE